MARQASELAETSLVTRTQSDRRVVANADNSVRIRVPHAKKLPAPGDPALQPSPGPPTAFGDGTLGLLVALAGAATTTDGRRRHVLLRARLRPPGR